MKVQGFEMRSVGAPMVLAVREVGPLSEDQALVEVAACGVCHTDLGFLDDGVPTRHPIPLVLGHEIVGQVIAAGPAHAEKIGRNVIVPAVMPCGRCDPCSRGRGDICSKQVFPGNDDHGGFASHVVVPAAPLCLVPEEIEGEALLQLSVVADAVSTAYAAVKKSGLAAGDFCVFVGAGGVGGFGVQIARALGARPVAINVDDARLAVLEEHGAEWTINARELNPRALKKAVKGIAKEAGLPGAEWKVFETSGTAAGQEAAFQLLTFGGVLSIVGFHPGEVCVRLSNLMAFAARAEGTWGCAPALFPEILRLVLDGGVVLQPFVETHPLSEINEVLDRLRRHELRRRPVLVPDF